MKLLSATAIMVSAIISLAAAGCNSTMENTVTDEELGNVYQQLKTIYEDDLSHRVIQPAEGYLKYPYLIPSGYYKQMWDWDGFFMGKYFC